MLLSMFIHHFFFQKALLWSQKDHQNNEDVVLGTKCMNVYKCIEAIQAESEIGESSRQD